MRRSQPDVLHPLPAAGGETADEQEPDARAPPRPSPAQPRRSPRSRGRPRHDRVPGRPGRAGRAGRSRGGCEQPHHGGAGARRGGADLRRLRPGRGDRLLRAGRGVLQRRGHRHHGAAADLPEPRVAGGGPRHVGRTRRLPGLAPGPRPDRHRGLEHAAAGAARRARGRLRGRLLPRRAAVLLRRRRPAVHAVRPRAHRRVLQHRPDRLRGHGRARPAGAADRPARLEPGDVRRRGRRGHPAPPAHPRGPRRADAARARAVRLLRRRPALRRRGRAHLAGPGRRRRPGGTDRDPRAAAQPPPDADREPAAAGQRARVVRAGPARDGHRHPRADPPAARRRRSRLRRDAAAAGRRPGQRR